MSPESNRCANPLPTHGSSPLDPRYVHFFDCFNQQRFFEAHEVLEALWLPARGSSRGSFYKGLIQVAGAFVHLQKGRPQPAAALLRLARAHLAGYGPVLDRLDMAQVLVLIDEWLGRLSAPGGAGSTLPSPVLTLQPPTALPH